MNSLMFVLKVVGVCFLVPTVMFSAMLTIYLYKQVRWDASLEKYRIKDDGTVVNPQGFVIEKPSLLLKELKGIEETICGKH